MTSVWQHLPKAGRKVVRMVPVKFRRNLRISLVSEGCVNRPFYTIQVKYNTQEVKEPGQEQIGSWDPLPNAYGEQLVAVNYDRLRYWMAEGAVPTASVCELLGLGGFLPVHPRSLLKAHRNRQKPFAEDTTDQGEKDETEDVS